MDWVLVSQHEFSIYAKPLVQMLQSYVSHHSCFLVAMHGDQFFFAIVVALAFPAGLEVHCRDLVSTMPHLMLCLFSDLSAQLIIHQLHFSCFLVLL